MEYGNDDDSFDGNFAYDEGGVSETDMQGDIFLDAEGDSDDMDVNEEDALEKQEDIMSTVHRIYFEVFASDEGVLNALFPGSHVPDGDSDVINLAYLLEDWDVENTLQEPHDADDHEQEDEQNGHAGEAPAATEEVMSTAAEEGNHVANGSSSSTTTAAAATSTNHVDPTADTPAEEDADVSENDSEIASSAPIFKDKPASRFLKAHLLSESETASEPATAGTDTSSGCILLKNTSNAKRADLQAQYAEKYPGLEFALGYENAQPTGWVLPMTVEKEIIEGLKADYSNGNWRAATTEDIPSFLMEVQDKAKRNRQKRMRQKKRNEQNEASKALEDGAVVSEAGPANGAAKAKPKKKAIQAPKVPEDPETIRNRIIKKLTRHIKANLHNSDALLERIQAAGGLNAVRFVAVDMEFAFVRKGAYPLPLELALLPVPFPLESNSEKNDAQPGVPEKHFFLHPGFIDDERTAIMLSCNMIPGGHGIPYKDANFLRYDYVNVVHELNEILADPRVILVNKGSEADLHAIRWVYAAANYLCDSTIDVPSVDSIIMYDVSAVEKLVKEGKIGSSDLNTAAIAATEVTAPQPRFDCWYHEKANPFICGSDDVPEGEEGEAEELAAQEGDNKNADEGEQQEKEEQEEGEERKAHPHLHCAYHDAWILAEKLQNILYGQRSAPVMTTEVAEQQENA